MSSFEWTFCVCLLTCLLNWSVSGVKTVQSGVKWIRPDLLSKGSRFFFRDDPTYEDYLVLSFHDRVELRDPQMKDGDASVILKKINVKDRGRNKCVSESKRSRNKRSLPDISKTTELVIEGSDQQITVKTGDNVTLQCLDHRGGDIELLEWRRQEENFFVCKHGNNHYCTPHSSFENRVELRDPEMKEGDVSVILKNVDIYDTGTYECYVKIKGSRSEFINSVYIKCEQPDQQITVKTGDDVILQCLDHRGGDIDQLEWKRQDLEENVFVCKNGKNDCSTPHPSFENRVKLIDPEMKDRDVSVILKNITINDAGTYQYYVRNSSTQFICNITLTVIDSGGDKDGGDRVGVIFGLSVVLVLAVFLVVGFTMYRKSKRLKMQIHQPPADEAAEPELQNLKRSLKEEEE